GDKAYCSPCLAKNYRDTGSPLKPSLSICQETSVRSEALSGQSAQVFKTTSRRLSVLQDPHTKTL
ncbi:MAG: hypothetical protein QGI45_02965, partial [Myxococcota bacterium]|nr:hypothetical protein [Myxococcota bacterium]